MFSEITNETRADWAEEALHAFADKACPNEDDLTAAGDLVCNLLHLIRLRHDVEDVALWVAARIACHNEEQSEEEQAED